MKRNYKLRTRLASAIVCLMIGSGAIAQVDVIATAGVPAGTYATLNDAFVAINAGTHQGDIGIGISANTTEAGSCVLNSSGAGASLYTSVSIVPTMDGVSISGPTTTGRGLIELKGADNVTIDGDNPNTGGTNQNLSIINTAANTTTYTSVIRIANAATVVTSSDNIIIRNCIITGSATGRNITGTTSTTGSENTTFAIYAGGNGGATATDAPAAVTSVTTNTAATGTTINALLINNNAINSCARAIVFNGASAGVSTGITISGNTIGGAGVLGAFPYTAPSNTVYTQAMWIAGTNALSITGNTIQNILSYVGTTMNGINLNGSIGTGAITISNNMIIGVGNNGSSGCNGISIASAAAGSTLTISDNTVSNIQNNATTSISGIQITSSSATTSTVSGNKVSAVWARSTGGYAARGIHITAGSNTLIQNNMVWDINMCPNNSATTTSFGARGINITSGTGHKVYNNSVSLAGPVIPSANPDITVCLGITSTSITGMDVRNNIFSNTMTGGSSASPHVCVQLPSTGTSAMNLTMNNNAYYSGTTAGQSGILVTTAPTLYTAANFIAGATAPATNSRSFTSTLSAAGTNDNASYASTNAAPFISATDLHLDLTSAEIANVEQKGDPAVTVATDIDGNTRPNALTTIPDMGADEVAVAACSSADGGTISPSAVSICAGQMVTMTSTGVTTGTGITYQWKVSTVSGGPYANVTGGSGGTSTSYTSAALASGVYYYILETNCSFGPFTDASNEVTVTVNALPVVGVSPTTATYCTGGAPITLTGSGAVGYAWLPVAGLSTVMGTSVDATPPSTTTYTVTGIDGNNCTATATAMITVLNSPGTPVVTPSSATICPAGSISLSATSTITAVLGSGTSTTSLSSTAAANFPNPYAHYYGGNKHQILILASELTAMGFTTGTQITSMGFPVASVSRTDALAEFQISMGHSALTSITAFQTGLTLVLPAATYSTNAAAGVNIHTLTSPFTWNGTDNMIIETSYSNNDGPSSGNVTMTYGATAFQSTIVYRVDNTSAAAVLAYSGAPTFTLSARPNITFGTAVNGSNFTWTPAATLSASTGSSVTASPVATTTYSVTADNGGCISSAGTSTITVDPFTDVNLTTTPGTTVCSGTAITITAATAGGTAPYMYTWSNSETTSVINVTPTVTTTYSVSVTDNCGNTQTESVTITVNPLPSVMAMASATTVCAGTSVTLTGMGTATSYTWDNSVSNGVPFTPTGTATYMVTGTDGNGCQNTDMITVTVNALPTVTGMSDDADNTVCAGTMVTLTGSGASTYTWAGATAVTDGAAFTPSATDTYTVTGTDANGCMNTATVMVTVNPVPTVTGMSDDADNTVCAGTMVTLTGGGAATYTWAGATTVTDGGAFTPSATDTYTVTGTDANGCMNTATVMVTVNAIPTVTGMSDDADNTICAGTMVTLSGGGAATYTWAGATTVTDGAAFTPSATDTYTVTGTDANGCMNTATVMVTVNAIPTVTGMSDDADNTICAGTMVTLTGGGAATYTWAGATTVTDGVAFTPSATDTYTVTGTDASGCMNTATVMVTVNSLPSASLTPFSVSVCDNGGLVSLSSGSPAGGVYSGTGVSGSTFDPSISGAGMFLITYTVTDVNSCSDSDTATITVDLCSGIAGNGSFAINVYPNPANGMVNVSISNATFSQMMISIVDIQGKEVFNETDKNVSKEYNKQINIEGFAKGVYYIKLNNGSDIKIQKLIVH
jgi:hypothetical protein